jgi:hypothetical protein
VFDALGSGETQATVGSMNEVPYDDAGSNASVVGAAVFRASKQTYVVASSAEDGNAGATLAYGALGISAARHVVFDAPEDANGMSDVTTTVSGDRCVVTITAGPTYAGHPLMFQTAAATDGCTVAVDLDVPPGTTPPPSPSSQVRSTSAEKGGCACRAAVPRGSVDWGALLAASVFLALSASRRGRKRR